MYMYHVCYFVLQYNQYRAKSENIAFQRFESTEPEPIK